MSSKVALLFVLALSPAIAQTIGGPVTGGFSGSVLFVDSGGNLAQSSSLNFDATGPALTVNNPGDFSNSTTKFALAGAINGCSPAAQYANVGFGPGSNGDMGVGGCVAAASGSAQTNMFGVWGSATSPDAGSDVVAGGFFAMAAGNGTGSGTSQRVRLWGINPLCEDKGFSHVICQNEFDTNVTGSDTLAFPISIVGNSTVAPAAGSAAISIGRPGPAVGWPSGIVMNDGATGATGIGVYLGARHSPDGNLYNSQSQRFAAVDASNVIHTAGLISLTDGGMVVASDIEGITNGNTYFTFGGVVKLEISHDGGLVPPLGIPFASLGSPANGKLQYCYDCVNASNPCAGGGTGAWAKRLNTSWDCR